MCWWIPTASSSRGTITTFRSTFASALLMANSDDDDQAQARSEPATVVIKVKVDDHFEMDKDACLAKCVYCKRSYKVNKTTKTNLTQHIKDTHPNKLVVLANDLQRRPKGEVPRVFQLLGLNVQDQFEKALLDFLLLTDQPFALIESESFRKMVQILNRRVTIYLKNSFDPQYQGGV